MENSDLGYRKVNNEFCLIGKTEFYFDKMSLYTVTAKEFLEGLELDRLSFISCLKNYGRLYQKYR